jgi:membrane-bound lytic murein transglycosylase MltF
MQELLNIVIEKGISVTIAEFIMGIGERKAYQYVTLYIDDMKMRLPSIRNHLNKWESKL